MEQNLPLEKEIADFFAKFPPFPDNVKEILVKIAPYLCMLGVFLGGIALLAVLGVGVEFRLLELLLTEAWEFTGFLWEFWQLWLYWKH